MRQYPPLGADSFHRVGSADLSAIGPDFLISTLGLPPASLPSLNSLNPFLTRKSRLRGSGLRQAKAFPHETSNLHLNRFIISNLTALKQLRTFVFSNLTALKLYEKWKYPSFQRLRFAEK
jgi:hypothetical protein